jgi:MYXO-CTERM domain-containing protein
MWLALRGAVEHARALRLAEPTRDVVITIVTDGEPSSCADFPNTMGGVVELAREAATVPPEIRTMLIGFASGFAERLDQVAAAGGSGKAIVIGSDPTTAQRLVTTLKSVRDDARTCRYGVPSVNAKVTPRDIGVSLTPSPGAQAQVLPLFGAESRCGNAPGFYVDDPESPKRLSLCPTSCALAHVDPRSKVDVSVGCGEGAPDGGVVDFDAGPCPEFVDVFCKTRCDSDTYVDAECKDGRYVCPPGSVSVHSCTICPAVAHGCCRRDGTFAETSCVAGAWVCPPGSAFFGSAGCAPPSTPQSSGCACDTSSNGSPPWMVAALAAFFVTRMRRRRAKGGVAVQIRPIVPEDGHRGPL